MSRAHSLDTARRQLLAIAVRETLRKHGIPASWIGVEGRATAGAGRERGMHLRLILREWDARLPAYMMALQREIGVALRRVDPMSSAWLAGTSWCFELIDDRHCPKLPEPATWATAPVAPPPSSARSALAAQMASDRVRNGHADFAPTQPLVRHATEH